MIYYILLCGFLLFIITSLMLCSCKKRKLNNIFHKILNKLKQLLNDLNNFINEEDNGINKFFSLKPKKEKDFFNYIGPQHRRH